MLAERAALAKQWWAEYEASRDPELLAKILRAGWATESGAAALREQAETGWFLGDLAAARQGWRQLLRHPEAAEEREVIARRLKLVEQQQIRGTGDGRSLAEGWPGFGGGPARSGAAAGPVDIGGRRWSVELVGEAGREVFPIVSPQVAGGGGQVVFFQDARGVRAVDLASGESLTGDDPLWPPIAGEVVRPGGAVVGTAGDVPAIAASRGRVEVFARTGSPIARLSRSEIRGGRQELAKVVLAGDEAGGWEVRDEADWPREPGAFADRLRRPELTAEPEPAALRAAGPPLVDGRWPGRVFVELVAAGWSGGGQDLHFVAALDAASGELVWSCPLAGSFGRLGADVSERRMSVLTAGGGLVYSCGVPGLVAAIDPVEGVVVWARTFPTEAGDAGEQDQAREAGRGPVPAMFVDGQLVAAPEGSGRLVCLAAESGETVWSVRPPEPVRQLVGVRKGVLVAGGEGPFAVELATGRTLWHRAVARTRERSAGRAVLAGGELWWPTADGTIRRLAIAGGGPAGGAVDLARRGGRAGNLVVLPRKEAGRFAEAGVVLVAEPGRLVCYDERPRAKPAGRPVADR